MMDKWKAQHEFWSSFGLPAYDENTVLTEGLEDSPGFPFITYQAVGGIMGQMLAISASLWYRSSSWAEISQKADEMLRQIQNEMLTSPVEIDGGYFWIKIPEATPFAQRMGSGTDDDLIKRILITVEAESLTNY